MFDRYGDPTKSYPQLVTIYRIPYAYEDTYFASLQDAEKAPTDSSLPPLAVAAVAASETQVFLVGDEVQVILPSATLTLHQGNPEAPGPERRRPKAGWVKLVDTKSHAQP